MRSCLLQIKLADRNLIWCLLFTDTVIKPRSEYEPCSIRGSGLCVSMNTSGIYNQLVVVNNMTDYDEFFNFGTSVSTDGFNIAVGGRGTFIDPTSGQVGTAVVLELNSTSSPATYGQHTMLYREVNATDPFMANSVFLFLAYFDGASFLSQTCCRWMSLVIISSPEFALTTRSHCTSASRPAIGRAHLNLSATRSA